MLGGSHPVAFSCNCGVTNHHHHHHHHHVASTSRISFLGHLVHMHCSTLGCLHDKPSCRHTINCGLVGLALALGGFLISLQHFFHTPNLFQLPLKTTLHAAHSCTHISTLVPEGVLCTVGMSMLSSAFGLHPTCTMCTMPIHKVPTYAHWPSSHPSMVGAPLCAHHTPPINLWQYSTLHPHPHTHSEPSCTATFGRCKRANSELW